MLGPYTENREAPLTVLGFLFASLFHTFFLLPEIAKTNGAKIASHHTALVNTAVYRTSGFCLVAFLSVRPHLALLHVPNLKAQNIENYCRVTIGRRYGLPYAQICHHLTYASIGQAVCFLSVP